MRYSQKKPVINLLPALCFELFLAAGYLRLGAKELIFMVNEGDGSATFLTVGEVAEYMRLSRMTVYRMIERGEIPALRVGRSFRVPKAALDNVLERTIENWERSYNTGSQFLEKPGIISICSISVFLAIPLFAEEVPYGLRHQEAPQAYVEEEAPQAAP